MNRFMRRRLLGYGAVAAALLIALMVAIAAFLALQLPFGRPGTTGATPNVNCSPTPCANVQGYTLWVSNVKLDGDLVSMQISFQNSSSATHGISRRLQLIDSKQHASGIVTSASGCQTWSRHEFDNGATFGPLKVCFQAKRDGFTLVLRWSPDFGLFCCRTDIKLT